MKQNKPALLLLPNLLGEHKHAEVFLPSSVAKAVLTLDGLIAESQAEGRRYLKRFQTKKPTYETPIALYNEHTKDEDLDFLLEPIVAGERWGYVSDAGLPCIADPGAKLVLRARRRGIAIQAFVGPSSILMALMQSGLQGQKFSFQGYFDKEPLARAKQIQRLAKQSQTEKMTQIVMEAPYRNQHAFEALLENLPEETLLCVAWDLTLSSQGIVTQSIIQWKKGTPPSLEKKPALFIFYCG